MGIKKNEADAQTVLSENNTSLHPDPLNLKVIALDAKALYEGAKFTAAELIERDLRLPHEKNFVDAEDNDVKRVRENIRLLVSSLEENRKLSTRYLRKTLFYNQEDGKTALLSIIQGLETKEDFDDFILFAIRDKKRCQALFESDFLQKLIEGGALPELGLSNEALTHFRHAFIRALVSKENRIRSWVSKQHRDKIQLTQDAIHQIIAAAGESDAELIDTLWYFVRDEKRLHALLQSRILENALNNQAEAVSHEHQKAMDKIKRAVPQSPEFKALQENPKQWKRWNRLFNANFYEPATLITLAIELYTHLTDWFGNWWHGKAEGIEDHAAIQTMFPVMDAVVEQQKRVVVLNAQLAQANKQHVLDKNKIQQLQGKNTALNNDAKKWQEEKTGLGNQIRDLKSQNNHLDTQLANEQKLSAELKDRLDALEIKTGDAIAREQKEKNTLIGDAEQWRLKNIALEQELNALRENTILLKNNIEEKQAQIDSANATIQALNKEKLAAETQVKSALEDNASLANALRERESNTIILQESKESASHRIETLTAELQDAKAQIQALISGNAIHLETIQLLKTAKNLLKNDVDTLHQDYARLLHQWQDILAKFQSVIEEKADELQAQETRHNNELSLLKSELAAQANQANEKIMGLSKTITLLKAEIDELQTKNNGLNDAIEEKTSALQVKEKQYNETLHLLKSELTAQANQANEKVMGLSNTITELKAEIDELQTKNNGLIIAIGEKRSELQTKETQYNSTLHLLKSELASEASQANEKIMDLSNTITTLKAEINELQTKNNGLNITIEKKTSELQTKEAQYNDKLNLLQSELTSQASQANEKVVGLSKTITTLKAEIAELQIKNNGLKITIEEKTSELQLKETQHNDKLILLQRESEAKANQAKEDVLNLIKVIDELKSKNTSLETDNAKLSEEFLSAVKLTEETLQANIHLESDKKQLQSEISKAKQMFENGAQLLVSQMDNTIESADKALKKAKDFLAQAEYVEAMTGTYRTKGLFPGVLEEFEKGAKEQKENNISFGTPMPTPLREQLFGNQPHESDSDDLNLTPIGALDLSSASDSQTNSSNERLSLVGQLNRCSLSSTSSNGRISTIPLSPVGQLNHSSSRDSVGSAIISHNALSPVGQLLSRESINPLSPVGALQRASISSTDSDLEGHDNADALSPVHYQRNSIVITPANQDDGSANDSNTLSPLEPPRHFSLSGQSTTAVLTSLSPANAANISSEVITPLQPTSPNDENADPKDSSVVSPLSTKRLSTLFQAVEHSPVANNENNSLNVSSTSKVKK